MPRHFTNIKFENYRSLANIDLPLGPLNLFFGPNGAGKSTILEAFWLVHAIGNEGLSQALRKLNNGVDLLWANASSSESVTFQVDTQQFCLAIEIGFTNGQPMPYPGERLDHKATKNRILTRKTNNDVNVIFQDIEKYMHLVTTNKTDDRLYLLTIP